MNTLSHNERMAKIDLESTLRLGKGVMYIKIDRENSYAYVTDWMGTLSIPIYRIRIGHHNIAGYQTHFRFKLDGSVWHGIQWTNHNSLDNGMYCRVYRTKQTTKET